VAGVGRIDLNGGELVAKDGSWLKIQREREKPAETGRIRQ